MSVDPCRQSPTLPPSKNRSVISRFAAHFGNRTRNISEFYIQPDDPWRTYFTGDAVKGTVVLTIVKPLRITHLVICLHAYVKIFKNTIAPGEAGLDIGFLGPGRGRRGSEYLGNGFATLFEDETVLCGDGRLKEGMYKFQFVMELPPYSLPSSINFERGTISYILTSTLTRPTTITPTTSCHRRINVLENLDIAPFPAPKPRVVSLEPMSKKSKGKMRQRVITKDDVKEPLPIDRPPNATLRSELGPPLSPAPSEISESSPPSASSQSFNVTNDVQSIRSARSDIRTSAASVAEKSITATTELLRASGLPGDTVPVQINIQHIKHVRSPHGVIVTLYRQGRIDMHPPLPVGSLKVARKAMYEDPVPKSRSGLSGLSFGTSRTNGVFRKDLSQTFAPLIVDPVTMLANVKASIRIPEDAFPTITRVPGGMISFRYYVEVVIDLRGKLATGDRYLPRLNLVSSGPNFSTTPGQVAVDGSGMPTTSNWGGSIFDTDPIRREKGVIAIVFEIVVGTKDSRRTKAKDIDDTNPTVSPVHTSPERLEGGNDYWGLEGAFFGSDELYDHDLHDGDGGDYSNYDYDYWPEYPATEEQTHQALRQISQPPPPPPPEPAEPLDEKARLRHEEAMLLPSQPPEQSQSIPSNVAESVPSAPAIIEDDHGHNTLQVQDIQKIPRGATSMSSVLSTNTIVPSSTASTSQPPALNHHSSSPHDDKQELERQRLLLEASAPISGNSQPTGRDHESAIPSAPILDDEDNLNSLRQSSEEVLPQYRR